MFHYALNEPGYLVLGTAETVGGFVGFTAADAKNKIYARAPGPVRLSFDFGDARPWSAPHAPLARPPERPSTVGDVRREADRAILAAVAPAGVVVSDDLAILEFRGEIAPYLEPVPGVATLDLLRMAREELRLTLRRAVDDARSSGKPVRARVALDAGGAARQVDVEIVPFTVAPSSLRCFAVLFKDRAPTALAPTVAPPADAAHAAIEEGLRRELTSTREYLQSVIEQLEAGNEELKAANEEIVSSNEELQSTNEELQTAKEELQATNEELRTVNDEMLDRNVDATRLADDLTNILSSVAIPIVFLGRDSRIRRFTPTASKVLNLIASDVGRPITDIQGKIPIPDLTRLIAEVLERLVPLEQTVHAGDGRWYQLGVRPYMTLDNRIDGTVVTVYDIDALKRAELLLAEARDYAESIVDTMRESLVVLDGDLRVRSANRAFYTQFESSAGEVEGKRLDAMGARQWDVPELTVLLERLARGEQPEDARFEREFPSIGARTVLASGHRMAKTGWILLTLADITERARMEDRLARSEAGFRRMLTSAAEAIVMSDVGGRIVFANEMATRIFGYSEGEMLGRFVDELLPTRLRAAHAAHRAEFMASPVPRPMGRGATLLAVRKDGTELPVEVALSPMEGSEGRIIVAFVADISARRETEKKIADYQAKLQRMAFEAALSEERERRRIAQDLHDSIGQSLALARIKLEALRKAPQTDVPAGVEAAIDLIAASIEDARTLTFELAPPVLYDLGLKPALSWLGEDLEKRSGLRVELTDDGSAPHFDEATAAILFRAVRELLTNVYKHGRTLAARVALTQTADTFEIRVEDAGSGFDPEKTGRGTTTGFGLFSVREQIARLGGTIDIESAPEHGTRVSVRIPMPSGTLLSSSTRMKVSHENPTGG